MGNRGYPRRLGRRSFMGTGLNIKDTIGYQLITDFYGDGCANRSGVPLMNHINEGITILDRIGAEIEAQEAFATHPLFQNDDDLSKNFGLISKLDQKIVALSFEYRNVANRFLTQHMPKKLHEVKLSPIVEVNQMLIADKVQNRKDFLLYHFGTHQKSDTLDIYFKLWLSALNISEERYQNLIEGL